MTSWVRKKKQYQGMSEGEFKFYAMKEWEKYQANVKYNDDKIPFWEYYSELCVVYERKNNN